MTNGQPPTNVDLRTRENRAVNGSGHGTGGSEKRNLREWLVSGRKFRESRCFETRSDEFLGFTRFEVEVGRAPFPAVRAACWLSPGKRFRQASRKSVRWQIHRQTAKFVVRFIPPRTFFVLQLLMKYHQFPGTDLSVSRLCFGCWGITGDLHWGDRVEEESVSAMLAAVDFGVNFFDTAPMYADGASESLLGKVLAENGLRQKTIVASKIRPDKMTASDIKSECEDSLKRLQTDYLDLYQTHWTNRSVPLAETWGAMQELQQQGKVRHIGVCNMGVGDLTEVSAVQKPLANQLPYNLLWRMIETDIQPLCVKDDIGILVYSPLLHGMLADKYQTAADVPDGRARSRHFSSDRPHTRHGEAGCEDETFAALDRIRSIAADVGRSMADVSLAWLIQQPGIASVIAGARNAQQVQSNISFLEQPLSNDVVERLNAATQELKSTLGSNPDMWDGGDNSRYR